MGSKEKRVCLEYGNLITKILEQMRFNFGEEEFVEYVTKIWTILATIRCEIIEAKMIEKPSNKKKRKVDDLKAPIDLEDFDYIIPHLPSTEDILKS